MANPNETELLPPSGAVTRGPALGSPELSTEYLARIKENLEVLLGRRGGSHWDRAVTFRDLHGMGWHGGAGGGGMVFNMAGMAELDTNAPGFQQFVGRLSNEIMRSAAFKSLKTRIGSAESNAHLPDEIKRQLQLSLLQVAREHQAAIETVENKIQTSTLSMASRLREITASLDRTAAGVREFDVAYADRTQAIALKVTQLAASLEGAGSVELEERFQAIADEIDGLQGQWSIKIQAIGASGIPVIAGIALSVESPIAGPGTSSLIFMAEKFGFVTENGTTTPFVIVGNQIEFTGNVRINGNLVIGADGLQPGFEAPDTKNSDLVPSIAAAAQAAIDAQADADAANAAHADAARDDLISRGEKPAEILRWAVIQGEVLSLYGEAGAFGKIAERDAYGNSYDQLEAYLNGLSGWGNTSVDTPVVRTAYIERFADYYASRLVLVNAINTTNKAAAAAAQATADDVGGALPGINADIAARLKRDANNTLTGQIALQSSMALLVGTTLNGIWIGTDGIYATEGGVVKVSIPLNGAPTFDGVLMAAGVITGAVSIAAGGKLTVGAATTFGGEGVFLGYIGNVVKFSIVSGATKLLYDPTSPTPLQIIGPAITGANLNAYTASISGGTLSGEGANGFRSYGSRTASVSGNFKAPLSYSWRVASRYSNDGTVLTLSNDSTATVTVSGVGYDEAVHCVIVCNITDDNGLSRSVGFDLVQQHGTPP